MNKMAISQFVSHLKSLDVQLFIEGDYDASPDKIRLRCNAPEGTLTNELRQELVERKAELVAYLHQLKLQSIDAIQKLGSLAGETPTPQEFLPEVYMLGRSHPK